MNEKMIHEFVQRYGARVDYQHGRSSFETYGRSVDYYDYRKSVVDIELSRQEFEHLVEADHHAEVDYRVRSEEARLRSKYPALETAYSKYKMLLELYK